MRYSALLIGLVLAGPAVAQLPAPAGTEQGSRMGLPNGNISGANNGVGTEGSLDRNAGKATSTVAGVRGGTASFGASDGGHAKPAENDPAIGGGDQKPK